MREGYLSSSGWLEKLKRSGRVEIPSFVVCKTGSIEDNPWSLDPNDRLDSDVEGQDYSRTEYTNLTTLVEFLNKGRPEEMGGRFKITSDGYVTIGLRKREKILLRDYLAEVLGFQSTMYCGNGTPCSPTVVDDMLDDQYYDIRAESKPDLRIAGYNLFVCSNLVKETLVGNRQVKLLRTVPVFPQDAGKYVSRTFQTLRYIPFSSSFFEDVEIVITDDIGDQIEFEWGKVMVTIHARRILKQ